MFQKSVLDKYIKSIDAELLEQKYKEFQNTYQNPQKIEQIKSSKEEQYQEGFLRDVFVAILGYTINPEPNYNLITEKRNESKGAKDARKADGAIIINNQTKCVIELKGTDTTDLAKIENQALGYKAHNKGCRYIIISNFEKLRFYIDDATDFLEFHLFSLDFTGFATLYTLLALPQITADIPAKIKEQSLSREEQITKALYKDYTDFKNALFADLCEQNKDTDELELFSKSQKLLDRFLFIFFCEDKGLLPPNSVLGIISRFKTAKENYFYQPLYTGFKQFFSWIDTGFKDEKIDIFAYNGGLFKSDELLDRLKISDEILEFHCQKIANYDFDSDVSVDILGHIFEHSISEIESKKSELSGIKEQNKRKKDGIFYTPAYITKYIVESTLGALCETKKSELGINENFTKSTKTNKQEKIQTLKAYREYLLGLKICDPACGSGAFLNATLKYLKAEHKLLDELENALYGSQLDFSYYDDKILENNIYGVDINGESVEIAKLSLWLNTAKKGTKLSTLSGKIKCGNSLITELFDWQAEFPEVFANGGFDVIIGNPPYVNIANLTDENARKYYQKNYKTVKNKSDLYSIFTEKSKQLLKDNAYFGFIFPNSWMGTDSFLLFRKFLSTDVKVYELVELPPNVFADATVTPVLCFYENTKPSKDDKIKISYCENFEFKSKDFVLTYNQILNNPNLSFSFEKTFSIENINSKKLFEIAEITLGIKTSDDKRFILKEKIDDDCYLMLRGRNISRFGIPNNDEFIWYRPDLMKEKVGCRPGKLENFLVDEKILIQDIATEIIATIDTNKFLCNDTINVIFRLDKEFNMKFILCILNSRLINIWFKKIFPAGLHIKKYQLEQIPIPNISLEFQKELADLADIMIDLNAQFAKLTNTFFTLLKANYNVDKIPSALSEFYALEFKDFLKLSKLKVPISEQGDLFEFFERFKADCLGLNAQIKSTDERINTTVYKLYNLTSDEIKAVENS